MGGRLLLNFSVWCRSQCKWVKTMKAGGGYLHLQLVISSSQMSSRILLYIIFNDTHCRKQEVCRLRQWSQPTWKGSCFCQWPIWRLSSWEVSESIEYPRDFLSSNKHFQYHSSKQSFGHISQKMWEKLMKIMLKQIKTRGKLDDRQTEKILS